MIVKAHIEDNLKVINLLIEIIYPHKIKEKNPLSIFSNNFQEKKAHIINGKGPFKIEGDDINLENERTININQSLKIYRPVLITDVCIPENNYSFIIQTFKIGYIEIISHVGNFKLILSHQM